MKKKLKLKKKREKIKKFIALGKFYIGTIPNFFFFFEEAERGRGQNRGRTGAETPFYNQIEGGRIGAEQGQRQNRGRKGRGRNPFYNQIEGGRIGAEKIFIPNRTGAEKGQKMAEAEQGQKRRGRNTIL